GEMWFTESAANQIGEVNPTTHAISEFPVPTPNSLPFGIAAGPDGNIWFTEKNADKIGVINPNTHLVTEFPIATPSSQPNAIAAGPDGTLWFTEQTGNKVTLLDPVSHSMTETATPVSSPLVIVPGADGNMWFTEGANPGAVASINPITRAITSFPTPTSGSGPIGAAPGSDGNVWFGENSVAQVGRVGVGAPSAVVSAPVVTGTPQSGQTLTCQPATFSPWAGQQPTFAFGFDGVRWLLDGGLIAGATGQALAVPSADVGHQISCEEIATYPLLTTTVPAGSGSVTVSPALGASLVSTRTTPTSVSMTLSCQGLASQTCSGTTKLTSHVTTQGSKLIAVVAKAKKKPKPRPPKKVTKLETVGSGTYSIPTGRTSTITLSLNSTGKELLTARYKVPATLTLSGTASGTRTLAFKYSVINISPSFTWHFSKTSAFATELGLSHLPEGSKVTLTCMGRGCAISKKTFNAPKRGKLALAPALKKRALPVGSIVQIRITASNAVGEVVVFTVVAGRSPTESFRCLPPGARAPSACVS
ncbi:MAG: virginiamycin B lyase family protein, partial [Solirubrobacteraceae bacterium]